MFNIVSKPKSIFQVKAALFDTQICEVITRPDDEGKITVDLPEDIVLWKLDVSRFGFIHSFIYNLWKFLIKSRSQI